MEYRMKTEWHHNRSIGWYVAFGIQAYRQKQLLVYIPDVFCNRRDAEAFVNMCNRLHLETIHLHDVLEDILP